MKKIFSIAIAGVAALSLVSCADDLVDQNIDPSNVTETLPPGLMEAAINAFQPTDYLIWYYNVNYFTRWDQMGTPSGGFGEDYTAMAESGGQGSQYINTMKYQRRIEQYIKSSGETKYNGYLAATNILTVYLAIFDSDMYGDIPYTEACKYETEGILTPKYDKMETLYSTWVSELDNDIALLTQTADLESATNQDPAYGCDWAKWAKLANSLKLKIAARLYNVNGTAALNLAKEAASNSAGLITSTDDDFLFCKATAYSTGNSDYVYGTGNGLATIYASKNVLDFMLDSKDPRVRFIYQKNGFNSKVVQGFIDQGKYDDLPTQVKEKVILDKDGNFSAWAEPGEPWVRYTSIPVVYDPKSNHGEGKAITDEEYEEYFNYGTRYQLSWDGNVRSYNPFCYYTNEMRRGKEDYTVPTVMTVSYDAQGNASVNTNVIQDTEDKPLYQMYMGAGEVCLYLAEFGMLQDMTGATAIAGQVPAQWYYEGVMASVDEFDQLAWRNGIPYYGTTYDYDPNEKAIDLESEEVNAMILTDNVKWDGSLEKIYLQQLINFSEMPNDQFVTARRSGFPSVNSKILPFAKFDAVQLSAIPRRFEISEPVVTDLMYEIQKSAYADQGFSHFGTNNSGMSYNNSGNAPLNTERVWFDSNTSVQWGCGSSLAK